MTLNPGSFLVLIILVPLVASSGNIPPHIDPGKATVSDNDLRSQQLWIINELLFYRSEMFISLNKGNIKDARENFDAYLRLLRENDNILVKLDGEVYSELKESEGILNLSTGDIDQLRSLYDEGMAAYKNNQTDKASQIAVISRKIIRDLDSLQQEQIMDAVAKFSGVNITLYQNGLSTFNDTLKEIHKRWRPVELTLFDDTVTKLSVTPSGGEFGETINIIGNLTLPKNRSGVPNATMIVKLDNETLTRVTTDMKGNYNHTFKIPHREPGNHTIQVDFAPFDEPVLSSSAKSTFFIRPSITGIMIDAKPDHGEYGDILNLSGGLTARNISRVVDANIILSIDDEIIATVKTDKNGTYKYDLKISMIKGGNHTIRADFNSSDPLFPGATNETTINVKTTSTNITVHANKMYVVFGDLLYISGKLLSKNASGISNADIAISIDNETSAKVKTDESGSYQYDLTVPMITSGHILISSGFIPSRQPLLPSGNATEVEVMMTNTTLTITGPKVAYQNDNLNITGNLLTSEKRRVPSSNITLLLDSREIGTAIVMNGNFSFNYRIAKNVSPGDHIVTTRFNGEASLLPSYNSMPVEIKTDPAFYRNIIFATLMFAVLLGVLYLRKQNVRIPQIEALVSALKARSSKPEIAEGPLITIEPAKEEIEPVEPQVPDIYSKQDRIFAQLNDLIAQKEYRKSISISFKEAKDHISTISGIKNTPERTHREFYDLVKKSAPIFADEIKELAGSYEIAVYSTSDMDASQALKAIDILKKIYNIGK